LAVVVVTHLQAGTDTAFRTHFYQQRCSLPVCEPEEGSAVEGGTIYFAPPNYHLLINPNRTFSYSVDPPVHYSRPSIDVLFESAADAYGEHLIGVVLTGANMDGSMGLVAIHRRGGLTLVQDFEGAEYPMMPREAEKRVPESQVLSLPNLLQCLIRHSRNDQTRPSTK
jgi:two-component system chemotaxis response regulator CheB